MSSLGILLALAVALRIGFFAFGLYQDEYLPVKYTDIDYLVFSDAAKYVSQGASPYLRETYRYTPLLAFMLVPNCWGGAWCHFGKILFIVGDLVTGIMIAKLLFMQNKSASKRTNLVLASIWLLNPMVVTISTRGSSESILTSMIMLSLYYGIEDRIAASAFWLGLAIHFKIYPVIYLPSMLYYLSNKAKPVVDFPVIRLVNCKNLKYLVVTGLTFAGLSGVMYLVYGREFLEHSYFYHFTRLDHRHNFSVYHMLLYYKSAAATAATSGFDTEKMAFVPQLVLSAVVIPLLLAKSDLSSSLFIQTFTFVTFNKVITSQYFIWFLIFLPHFLSRSDLISSKKLNGVVVLSLWIASQALWLYNAYRLEFLGENTFDYALFNSSLFFFLSNCICIHRFIVSL
ncbi:uncharacterized protein LODBEIA_P48720 [Lodderomyces beijingensis]|uniref:GPI mannosyltransferase 1 n=1 Tax=Lodderomyces beijingensis TaxID=1775926 RepID=A0ABP0ZR59_9ASCO